MCVHGGHIGLLLSHPVSATCKDHKGATQVPAPLPLMTTLTHFKRHNQYRHHTLPQGHQKLMSEISLLSAGSRA